MSSNRVSLQTWLGLQYWSLQHALGLCFDLHVGLEGVLCKFADEAKLGEVVDPVQSDGK